MADQSTISAQQVQDVFQKANKNPIYLMSLEDKHLLKQLLTKSQQMGNSTMAYVIYQKLQNMKLDQKMNQFIPKYQKLLSTQKDLYAQLLMQKTKYNELLIKYKDLLIQKQGQQINSDLLVNIKQEIKSIPLALKIFVFASLLALLSVFLGYLNIKTVVTIGIILIFLAFLAFLGTIFKIWPKITTLYFEFKQKIDLQMKLKDKIKMKQMKKANKKNKNKTLGLEEN